MEGNKIRNVKEGRSFRTEDIFEACNGSGFVLKLGRKGVRYSIGDMVEMRVAFW